MFQIDWASLGRKFTVFALFFFVYEGNFQVQAPWGAYIWRGDLTESFLHYEFGGAYKWRGLSSEFYGTHFFSSLESITFWGLPSPELLQYMYF